MNEKKRNNNVHRTVRQNKQQLKLCHSFFYSFLVFLRICQRKTRRIRGKKVADSIQIHFFDDRQLSVQEWKDLWTSNPFFPQKMVGVCSNVPTTVFIVRDTFIIYLSLFPQNI
jgi:hypothetical protein